MRKAMSGVISRAKSNIKRISKTALNAVHNNINLSRRTLFIAPVALIVSVVAIFGLSFNTSYAYAVSYRGETIGYVSSEDVYTEAMDIITENTDAAAEKSLSTVQVEEQVATGKEMLDAEGLSKAIVENIDDIEESYGLFIDDSLYASCENEKVIEDAIAEYLINYELSDAKLAVEYSIQQGVYSMEAFLTKEELCIKLESDGIQVSGYKTETHTEKIDYKTVTQNSDKYAKGEIVTAREGEYGKRKITEKVYYVGDEAVSKEEISNEITKQPAAKYVIEGSGKSVTAPVMSFPFRKGTDFSISSYFGEPRYGYYHKGMDIIADYGTPILAAAGGKVIESGYSTGGWGNTVLIDHGNGVQSRYAHCSSLNVSVGDTVNRGDHIAGVGSTGDSQCNHLHFEVYENGVRVDPIKYITK